MGIPDLARQEAREKKTVRLLPEDQQAFWGGSR